MMAERQASEVIKAAEAMLQSAQMGLDDLLGDTPKRRVHGLRCLVVFGRAVTNALQGLRGVDADRFNAWYNPIVEDMRADEIMKYLYDLRTLILKRYWGMQTIGAASWIENFDQSFIYEGMLNAEPGQFHYWEEDSQGVIAWVVISANGERVRNLITLPSEAKVKVSLNFQDPPLTLRGEPLAENSVQFLSTYYIHRLSDILAEAKRQFA